MSVRVIKNLAELFFFGSPWAITLNEREKRNMIANLLKKEIKCARSKNRTPYYPLYTTILYNISCDLESNCLLCTTAIIQN